MIDSDTLKILSQFWDRKEEGKAQANLSKEIVVGIGELLEQMAKPDEGDAAIALAIEGLREDVRNAAKSDNDAAIVRALDGLRDAVLNLRLEVPATPAPEMKGWTITIRSRDMNGKAEVISLEPQE